MVPSAAKHKARVRTLGWMCPSADRTGATRVRAARGMRSASVMRAVVWPPTEFRRALGIAIAIVLAGLLIGALIAAWAGGAIPGPARPPGEPPAESPGESPGGSPAKPGALPERPSPGYPAPGIDCKTAGGERVRLGGCGGSGDCGDCAGGVTLLVFFSAASGASLAHISVLAEMYAEGFESARILTVAVCQAQDAVASYMEARKLDLPVIADPRGELARLYDITAVPTTFVIDAQGIVRDLRVGAMTRAQLERAVRLAL